MLICIWATRLIVLRVFDLSSAVLLNRISKHELRLIKAVIACSLAFFRCDIIRCQSLPKLHDRLSLYGSSF